MAVKLLGNFSGSLILNFSSSTLDDKICHERLFVKFWCSVASTTLLLWTLHRCWPEVGSHHFIGEYVAYISPTFSSRPWHKAANNNIFFLSLGTQEAQGWKEVSQIWKWSFFHLIYKCNLQDFANCCLFDPIRIDGSLDQGSCRAINYSVCSLGVKHGH